MDGGLPSSNQGAIDALSAAWGVLFDVIEVAVPLSLGILAAIVCADFAIMFLRKR